MRNGRALSALGYKTGVRQRRRTAVKFANSRTLIEMLPDREARVSAQRRQAGSMDSGGCNPSIKSPETVNATSLLLFMGNSRRPCL